MKKLLIALLLAGAVSATAQKYEPNTKWPYVYETFQPGTIYFDGKEKTSADLNIHLWGNVLHYVSKDGKIYQSSDNNVVRVEMAGNAYIFSDHKLVKIIANEGNSLLVKLTRGDFDALRSAGGGAYGASTNSSATRDLSSLGFELGGLNNPELGLMLQEKRDGRAIPIVEQYFFILDGQQIEANKRSVEKFLGDDKADQLKQFLKANKTKWKNEESLKTLLKFLAE
jgi:hypothetical protein